MRRALIRDDFAGVVPERVDDLLRLPGVGRYTAHAVASFAFAQPVAVLDTNVGRVLARALANAPLGRVEAQRLADELLPARDSASFNQAMLDLGAQYCRAAPQCESCPVRRQCAWQRSGGSDPAPLSAAVSRPQAPYAGSNREQRGRVLRLLHDAPRSKQHLVRRLAIGTDRANEILDGSRARRTGRKDRSVVLTQRGSRPHPGVKRAADKVARWPRSITRTARKCWVTTSRAS